MGLAQLEPSVPNEFCPIKPELPDEEFPVYGCSPNFHANMNLGDLKPKEGGLIID